MCIRDSAMGALTRVAPGAQQRYIPIPYQTRQMLYAISPTFALLQPYIETEMCIRDRINKGSIFPMTPPIRIVRLAILIS